MKASWARERHGRRTRHGFINTGYLAALMADREAILAEARAQGLVPVRASEREIPSGAVVPVVAHTRTAPSPSPSTERLPSDEGTWVGRDGRHYRYKIERDAADAASPP